MNNRILELAKQAGYEVDMFGYGHWDMPECKKFAELIVRECAHIANENANLGSPYCGQFVRRHFGVE